MNLIINMIEMSGLRVFYNNYKDYRLYSYICRNIFLQNESLINLNAGKEMIIKQIIRKNISKKYFFRRKQSSKELLFF